MYIDNEKINEAIRLSGLKKKWIAEQLDITYNINIETRERENKKK